MSRALFIYFMWKEKWPNIGMGAHGLTGPSIGLAGLSIAQKEQGRSKMWMDLWEWIQWIQV